ncbi:MAG TPA: MFS transporter [Acidimicrobiia bacterium]|nr:MFS transporter [Acidimicrobiia bacterium]
MRVDKPSQNGVRAIPRGRIAVLGLITIAIYGSWFYSFGVLLDPIIEDTGWSEPTVAAVFSFSSVIAAIGALIGGWLLDQWGTRLVFGMATVAGAGGLVLASSAPTPALFATAGAIGGGVLGSLGFYHVTQTAAVRISPGSEDRAIAVLTIWGAFASVLYIPLTAWLVTITDWRMTLRILGFSTAVALVAGVLTIDTRRRKDSDPPPLFRNIGRIVRSGPVIRLMASQALAGIAVGTILVYQVPAMTAAGLALGLASFWAGFRGFAQLGGRLPLMSLVRRFGVASSLKIAYGAIAIGSAALAFSGNQVLAAAYAVFAGFGIGAVSPLIGMHSKNVFGRSSMGTAMGLVSLVFLGASAVGPVGAAWLSASSGSRALPVLISAGIMVAAALVIRSTD